MRRVDVSRLRAGEGETFLGRMVNVCGAKSVVILITILERARGLMAGQRMHMMVNMLLTVFFSYSPYPRFHRYFGNY